MKQFESINDYRLFMKLPDRAKELFWEYKYRFLVTYGDEDIDIVECLDYYLPYIFSDCESPIEMIMYLALVIQRDLYKPLDKKPKITIDGINRQCELEGYRVDFFIVAYAYSEELDDEIVKDVVVECDGHDYHERTKQQVVRANNRDFELKNMGYDVLHFSGSQIFNDPIECATKVYDYIISEIDRKINERRRKK